VHSEGGAQSSSASARRGRRSEQLGAMNGQSSVGKRQRLRAATARTPPRRRGAHLARWRDSRRPRTFSPPHGPPSTYRLHEPPHCPQERPTGAAAPSVDPQAQGRKRDYGWTRGYPYPTLNPTGSKRLTHTLPKSHRYGFGEWIRVSTDRYDFSSHSWHRFLPSHLQLSRMHPTTKKPQNPNTV
jgi:hypothetical protein